MIIVRSLVAIAAGLLTYLVVLLAGGYAVDGLVRYQYMPPDVAWRLTMLHLPAAVLASFVSARLAPMAPVWHATSVLVLPEFVAVGDAFPLPQRATVVGCALVGLMIGIQLARGAAQRHGAPAV
jgi:hypothetical protein